MFLKGRNSLLNNDEELKRKWRYGYLFVFI